jgi:hypothetical protein
VILGVLDTAGERLQIDSELHWVADLLEEGAAGALERDSMAGASVTVHVEAERRPFDTSRRQLLARGAWARDGEVVVENALASGFDVHVRCVGDQAEFTYRWRPPRRERAAAVALRSRFHLLARAALMQYPALWSAAARGRVPLHVSACTSGDKSPLVVSPSGVGRSTLVAAGVAAGGGTTGDNLAVGDGETVWGLVEPVRMSGVGGRPMPHGRGETAMSGRLRSLVPDALVVLSRGRGKHAELTSCSSAVAARSLVTSTYMAGELRRYWAFAATLAAGTGVGPAHPPVAEVAEMFAAQLPCYALALGSARPGPLSELIANMEVEHAWA